MVISLTGSPVFKSHSLLRKGESYVILSQKRTQYYVPQETQSSPNTDTQDQVLDINNNVKYYS
jgi:hypothetical protein